MSGENLTTQLGAQYVAEFMRGALFLDAENNRILMLSRPRTESILGVHVLMLDNPEGGWGEASIAASKLKSFKDLAWPKLGYRNLENDKVGNLVVYYTSDRTVHRGLRQDHLHIDQMSFFDSLGFPVMDFGKSGNDNYRLCQLFKPKWYTYAEGMNLIKENKIPAFALNEDIAVAMSFDQGAGRFCDIFFRGVVVGQITENGEIMITNKVMKRSNLKKMYAMLEN